MSLDGPLSSSLPAHRKLKTFGLLVLSLGLSTQPLMAQTHLPTPYTATPTSPNGLPLISNLSGPIGDQLRIWYAKGTAAGNIGDYYDNRDRGHSPLELKDFPQLTNVTYTEEEKKMNADWGISKLVRPAVTIGNSSTSAPVTAQGSNVRLYECTPGGLNFLFSQYVKSNLYFYPAHHDYLVGHNGNPLINPNGYGDLFVTNTPYVIVSYGSSYTDQPFIRAVAATLAAFRPEVKRKLVAKGLLMSTVQMIFRSSNNLVKAPEDYFKGFAHPPVFDGNQVNMQKMVQMAHDMTLEKLPPQTTIELVEAPLAIPGRDFFDSAPGETWANTSCAIATIYRSTAAERRYVLSAEHSGDPNGKPIRLQWVVLQDGSFKEHTGVVIKPLNPQESRIEITIPYHPRAPIAPGNPYASTRIDIAVIASNGEYVSPPSFFTNFSLDNEARTYDAHDRIQEVGYAMGESFLVPNNISVLLDGLRAPKLTPAFQLLSDNLTPPQRAALIKFADTLRPLQIKQQMAQEYLRDARKSKVDKDIQNAQASVTGTQKMLDEALQQKLEGIPEGVNACLSGVFSKLAANPLFAQRNNQILSRLLSTAAPDIRKLIQEEQNRLVAYGITTPPAAPATTLTCALNLTPLNPETGPLTNFEKSCLTRYHAQLIAKVLFPAQVQHLYRLNFVDANLTAPKSWRDVYHYDPTGRLLGWTRYDLSGRTEFTPEGLAILERDAAGRATKTARVRYDRVRNARPEFGAEDRANWSPLQQVLTKDTVTYTYSGPEDRFGHWQDSSMSLPGPASTSPAKP